MTPYRHEYKYRLTHAQSALLEARAKAILRPDPHAKTDGRYLIQSLYFDDSDDTCFYENEDGYNVRSKFRIRYYNQDSSFLRLEKKSKVNGMTRKESCVLTRSQCEVFLAGGVPEITGQMNETARSLLLEMRRRNLRPKVIVIYERVPFVCPVGNVRVTFDRGLRSSNEIASFLDGSATMRPVFPTGESLLEVKWDELLPDYIQQFLALDTLQWTSFSKYYLCRRYNCYGGIKT